DLLRQRVSRMDALLRYARIGRKAPELAEVSVGELAASVIEMHAPGPDFTVDIADDLPVLYTDQIALQQVLGNLLGNAIKHHDRPDGRVEVRWRELGEFYEFTVADDGPGIEPRFHDKIFDMFQTLRPRDEVEGSGMGLALVKKQLNRCGAMIVVESATGEGTSFRFTWPKKWPTELEDEE
ncbi:MAG: ATP-binding protein, partial [Myxococcota bacterium]